MDINEPPPPPPPPLPPSLPQNILPSSPRWRAEKLPEYLQNFPFSSEIGFGFKVGNSDAKRSRGIDAMDRFGPKAPHRISIELDIESQAQLGPTCGPTAIQMIFGDRDHYQKDMNQLMAIARSNGYSTYGEMFSASQLAELIAKRYNVATSVKENWCDSPREIVKHLLDGCPLLVPYDKSPTLSEPGFYGGHKAHWAVITGFCYLIHDSAAPCDDSHESVRNLIDSSSFDPKSLYLYARHGKTAQVCRWRFDELVRSNQNLDSVDPKFLSPEAEHFRIPPNGDLRDSLVNRIVVVFKKIKIL